MPTNNRGRRNASKRQATYIAKEKNKIRSKKTKSRRSQRNKKSKNNLNLSNEQIQMLRSMYGPKSNIHIPKFKPISTFNFRMAGKKGRELMHKAFHKKDAKALMQLMMLLTVTKNKFDRRSGPISFLSPPSPPKVKNGI